MGELLYAIIHRKSRSNANIFYKQGKTLGAMQIPSTASQVLTNLQIKVLTPWRRHCRLFFLFFVYIFKTFRKFYLTFGFLNNYAQETDP